MSAIMIQGTASDVGKSTIVAAICRVLARKNIAVAPFKPQNMALNSAVTADGGEIGRAQALQAQACFLQAHTDMNPILIKPSSDVGAQIIVCGRALSAMSAQEYHAYKSDAINIVLDAYARLKNRYEAIVIEGAGSPAEINLREGDIANMGFAERADCPVLLVGDIDKGGVFAQFVGTLELLNASERARVKGFIINKFRGDFSLLKPGLDWLEDYTGKPVLGVLPYHHGLFFDAEDAIDTRQQHRDNTLFKVLVPVLPRISNHSDFDALRAHPQIDLHFIALDDTPPPCDLIIIPGSKNVREDLAHLQQSAWPGAIHKHLRYGGKILGICGGLQMLGLTIADPHGIEGAAGESQGLGFLAIDTVLQAQKQLCLREGELRLAAASAPISGYEIHHGESVLREGSAGTCMQFNDGTEDGFLSEDQQVFGTYLHGLFDTQQACTVLLRWAGLSDAVGEDLKQQREAMLDRLADSIERHLKLDQLGSLLGTERLR